MFSMKGKNLTYCFGSPDRSGLFVLYDSNLQASYKKILRKIMLVHLIIQ